MRSLLLVLTTLGAAAPVAAQHTHPTGDHAQHPAHAAGKLPQGWSARTDRGQPLDQLHFMAMGDGYHAVLGPSAILYNPAWKKSGAYRVAARFRQNKAPAHPEAYGILLGGNGLQGPEQAYSYFLVRGTGDYFIATRRGAERVKVADWTPHPAVRKQDAATGAQTNVLGAEVRGDQVVFTVNGTEVARRPRSEILTDGVFGFRVNHNLDVMIDQVQR
jgi:hypothetical protein